MRWQSCTSGCRVILYLVSAQLPVISQFWAWTTVGFICRLLQEFPHPGLCLPVQPVALPGTGSCWDQREGKGTAMSVPWDAHHWVHGQTAKIPTLCVWLILFTSSVPVLVWGDRMGHEKALWEGIGTACPGTTKTLKKEELQCFPNLFPPLFFCIFVKCRAQVFRQLFTCLNNLSKMFKQFQLQLYLQLA